MPVEGSTRRVQRIGDKGKREKKKSIKPILLRAHQRSELEATREIHDALGIIPLPDLSQSRHVLAVHLL